MDSQHKDACFIDDMDTAPVDPKLLYDAYRIFEYLKDYRLRTYAGGFNVHESLLPEDLRGPAR